MDSKKMLEEIMKIREIRNGLNDLHIKLEEKEILRRSFNYYENLLNLDITRNNLNVDEFRDEGINTNNEKVEIPVDTNTNKYQEFTKVSDKDIINIINNLSNFNFDLDENSIMVILKSLKEYSLYLEQVTRMKQSNMNIYSEIFDGKSK